MNSFEALGLLPSFLEGLNEQETLTIAKHMAKALQFIYHPDKRPDAYLKSIAINEAIRIIESSSYNLQKEKQEYIENGPGQRETRATKEQLELLMENEALLNAKIEESKGKTIDYLFYGDDTNIAEWLAGFYRHGTALCTDAKGFPVAEMPGRKVVLGNAMADDEYIELEEKLNDLTREYAEGYNNETWEDAISDAEKNVRDAYEEVKKAKGKEAKKEAERQMHLYAEKLSTVKERKKKLEEEIKDTKKKLKKLKKDVKYTVYINDRGFVEGWKIKEKLRLIGCYGCYEELNKKKRDLAYMILRENLFPGVAIGYQLVAMDANGEINNIGVVQDIEGIDEEMVDKVVERKKKVETEEFEQTEKPLEKSLAKKEGITVYYTKNPLETLGLLPSLVNNLTSDELKQLLKIYSNGLKKAFHPDISGMSVSKMGDINAALELLTDEKIFEKSREEYRNTKPGEMERNAITAEIKKISENIGFLARKLAEAKVAEKRAQYKERKNLNKALKILKHFVQAVYLDRKGPTDKKARYLQHADGFEIAVSDGRKTEIYQIENKGFRVYAVSGTKRMEIIGVVMPDEFGDDKTVMEQLREKDLSDFYKVCYPILEKNGLLVLREKDRPIVAGRIISIQRQIDETMKAAGKKIAREISDKIKRKDREGMPSRFKTPTNRSRA
ncbi:MAG: hypothetical protein QXT45_02780 [Candidatus Bilamarchaeaceae archaeon]